MTSKTLGAAALAAALAMTGVGSISAVNAGALPGPSAAAVSPAVFAIDVEQVQYRGGPYRGYGPGPRFVGPGPRAFAPVPRYYGPGPRFVGPPRAWGYRPWYHRPYYGTIIGGLALGTIIGVTAYGLAPRAPRPDLCWYWADEIQSRGYWDYC